jgi:hypothetical protein
MMVVAGIDSPEDTIPGTILPLSGSREMTGGMRETNVLQS